jgi:hypothetical protein
MKKTLPVLLLLLSISSIASDWKQVGKTNENGTSFYVGTESINGNESLEKAWLLDDKSTSKLVKVNSSLDSQR